MYSSVVPLETTCGVPIGSEAPVWDLATGHKYDRYLPLEDHFLSHFPTGNPPKISHRGRTRCAVREGDEGWRTCRRATTTGYIDWQQNYGSVSVQIQPRSYSLGNGL